MRGDERQLCSLSRSIWIHLQQNYLFSQGTSPLLRLWERPLVFKCVIIVSFDTASLTRWPSDLLHLLVVPWWLRRDQTPHSCSLRATASSVDGCGSMSLMLWVCHTGKNHLVSPEQGWGTLKTDDSFWQEGISDSPVSATRWIVNITRNITGKLLVPELLEQWQKHTKSHLLKSGLTRLNSAVINFNYGCQILC